MKKLYLILLMLLILFIPVTNAVAVYQLDQPVKELNNHTLREVFEDGNNFIYDSSIGGNVVILETGEYQFTITLLNANIGILSNNVLNIDSKIYSRIDFKPIYSTRFRILYNFDFVNYFDLIPNEYNSKSAILTEMSLSPNRFLFDSSVQYSLNDIVYFKQPYTIELSSLGISHLTVEQMDKYYDLYLEAVRFDIENQEASQDLGGYQNIFRSIINGVKGLITEMGFVWQWLNAPIITSDMQDFNFIDSIDWSWDLIGVVRQILNSIGILVLQITFWVPSLAFAFMGIPVQVSILSLLFSNLIFLLLGWIMVKSFII